MSDQQDLRPPTQVRTRGFDPSLSIVILREKLSTRAEVQVATPHPKKSVSSVHIGHASANATASTGQSSGSRRQSRSRATASKLPLDIASDNLNQPSQRVQKGDYLLRITTAWDCKCRQVYLSLSESNFGNEERHLTGIPLDQVASSLPQDSAYQTARTRMLASRTRALSGIPLLLAGSSANAFVLLHQLILVGTPGRDHFVQ